MTQSPMAGRERGRPLAVMGAIALKMAVERFILPSLDSDTGLVTEIVWQPTTVLLRYVSEGKRGDVIIGIDSSIDALARDGIVEASTRMKLAHAVLGVAVKAGEPHPDISTVDAFSRALMAARGVAYSTGGASGIYFQELIARLGLSDRLSAVTIPAGFTAEKLVTGEADLAIQQISELLSVPGVEIDRKSVV